MIYVHDYYYIFYESLPEKYRIMYLYFRGYVVSNDIFIYENAKEKTSIYRNILF